MCFAWMFAPAAIVRIADAFLWPQARCGRSPEIDGAGWCGFDEARLKLLAAHTAFIDRLLEALDRPT